MNISPSSSGSKITESKKQSRRRRQTGMRFLLASAGFKFVLLFNPEDGGDVPVNIKLPPDYTTLELRTTALFTATIARASNPIWPPQFPHLSLFFFCNLISVK
jgi:hypothetical protein